MKHPVQLDLFGLPAVAPHEPTGEELRDEGIQRAVSHAEETVPDWADKAYAFLLRYMETHPEFMAEEVREASAGVVPAAPSARAWGGVIRRAASDGRIYRIGFQSVKNPKAHCAPCTLWGVKNRMP